MTSDARANRPQSTSPLPGPLRPLALLEPLYRWAAQRRNRHFDLGRRVWKAPFPVVSVGNLSVGGTGKTPVVARLARELLANDLRPVIAMRGYKAAPGAPSDEQAEYLESLPGVQVLAHPDRAATLRAFHASGGRADCVILDDGFQHRFVHRDLDIVLIDATRSPFLDRCLPAGRLREPVDSLARADILLLTRADRIPPHTLEALRADLRAAARADTLIACCRHHWSRLDRFDTPAEPPEREPPDALTGRRVFLLAGIGNPRALHAQVLAHGAQITAERILPDHARHTAAGVARAQRLAARSGAAFILTTAKDWVKIRPVAPPGPLPWLVPRVEIEFTEGAEPLLQRVIATARPPARPLPSTA